MTKFPNFISLSPVLLLLHPHTQHHLPIFLDLPLNLKFLRFCSTVPTLIRFLPGFWENVLLPLFLSSPTLSICLSSQFSSISKNLLCPAFQKTYFKDQLSNYRPISNFFVTSKVIERVVKCRLTDHLASNPLLNRSASICLLQALLYIHNRFINAVESHFSPC